MIAKKHSLYNLNIKTVLTLLVALFCSYNAAPLSAQIQTEYKIVSENLITNSTFDTGIDGWTVENPQPIIPENEWYGWRWDNTFTYGSALWIDNGNEPNVLAESNSMVLCQNTSKRIKFSYTSSNVGEFVMVVKLGDQTIGTFTENGGYAQSRFQFAPGVTGSIYRTILGAGNVNIENGYYYLGNNIWHDFVITISDYTGPTAGKLTFDYTLDGTSRMVYLDNVEVYEMIPTPVPQSYGVTIESCDSYLDANGNDPSKFKLNTLLPSPTDPRFTYTWYNDAAHTSPVSAAELTAGVPAGTYYLFASPNDCLTDTYSHAATVRVNPAVGCCGGDVILDGGFDLTDVSDAPTPGYLVPKGDNSNNGGLYWKRNFTNADDEFHIAPSVTLGSTTRTNALSFVYSGLAWNKLIYQKNPKISRWSTKTIEFELGFPAGSRRTGYFSVYLKPNVDVVATGNNTYTHDNTFATPLFTIYKTGSIVSNYRWYFMKDKTPSGITILVNDQPAKFYQSATNANYYELGQFYKITVIVPANQGGSSTDFFGGIGFWADNVPDIYVDNVSVKVTIPENPTLTNSTPNVNCETGLADLTPLSAISNISNNNGLTGLEYHWFATNSSEGSPIADPTKVGPGTYYLFAFNPDTRCYSAGSATVTVSTDNCPKITGSVYNDWDGGAEIHMAGGAPAPKLTDEQVYVLLLDPNNNNKVVKSTKLDANGNYTLTGVANKSYQVIISDRDAAQGTTTLPSFPPGMLATGESVGGTLDGTPDGKASVTTGANGTSTTVNFGVNRVPIQGDVTITECGTQKSITLTSHDNQPEWNGGAGKKLIIYTFGGATNGTLEYDGFDMSIVPLPTDIEQYDPTKLVFKRTPGVHDMSIASTVEFTYAFEDAAEQSVINHLPANPTEEQITSNLGQVKYTLKAVPDIKNTTISIASGETFNYTPANGDALGNIVPVGTTYSWTRTTPVAISPGGESGTGTADSGITATLTNITGSEVTVIYTVTAITPEGCESTFTITVNVAGMTYSCSDVWYSEYGGAIASGYQSLGIIKDNDAHNDLTVTPLLSIDVNGNHGSSAIAATRGAAGDVYFIPSQGASFAPGVYLSQSNGTNKNYHFAQLPQPDGSPLAVEPQNLTFDKHGNLWIMVKNSSGKLHLYVLPITVIESPGFPKAPGDWEHRGEISGLPAGNVADTEFNNGGSLYVLMESGMMRIINPLQVNNVYYTGGDKIVHVDQDIEFQISGSNVAPIQSFTGYTFTGIASLSGRKSFLVSAHNYDDNTAIDKKSILIELNMASSELGELSPLVTVVEELPDKRIGDLGSCAYIRNFWVGGGDDPTNPDDPKATDGKYYKNWHQQLIPRNGETLEFADGENNLENIVAIRDLHVDVPGGEYEAREVYDIINKTNKALVIPPGKTLIAHGIVGHYLEGVPITGTDPNKIIIQAAPNEPVGNLILRNKAYSGVGNGGVATDQLAATVQFYNKGYNACDCSDPRGWSWQYFGIPVQTSLFPYNDVIGDEIVNRWDEFLTTTNKWSPTSGNLNAFEGYEITRQSTTKPEDLTTNNLYTFKGNLVTGNTTFNLGTNTTVSTPRTLTFTSGVNYQGMNLIGNSYTGAVDIKNGLTFTGKDNNTIEATVYLFNTGTRDQWRKFNGSAVSGLASGQYLSVPQNLAGETATDGTNIALPAIIPSMHAFFVKVTGTTPPPSLTIDYSKLTENEKVNNVAWRSTSPLVGEPTKGERGLPNVVIDVLGTESADRVWLFQQPGTTQAFDNGWDGEKIIETGLVQIYVAGTDGNSYQVATVGDIADTRLGFTAEMNGKYTLNLSVSPEIAARNLSLVDTQTGACVTLRNGAEYSFTAKEGDNGKRFKIVTSGTNIPSAFDEQPIENEHYIKIYSHRNEGVKVINQSGEDCMIEVYDVTGKQVLKTKIRYNSMKTVLNSGSLHRGVYIVKVQGPTKREVKRILIH